MRTNQSTASKNRFPFAHTFSIVARDPITGQMGVAVQSHWFSTGSMVTWAEPGVGAIATQSMVEISYGPLGLEKMRNGKSAPDTLKNLLELDANRDVRQIAMIDAKGNIGVHTGSRCIAEAGHKTGIQYSVQANMMLKDSVWPAMAEAFEHSTGYLSDRMLAALEAAQAEGGDIRGQQSAAMLVVEAEKRENAWQGTTVDLRVEDNPEPLAELRRLMNINRAYQYMNNGDVFLSEGKTLEAFEMYQKATSLAPQIDELPFWQAVTLADSGRLEESLPIFKHVFAANRNWAILLERLPKVGMLKDDPELIRQILAQ